MSKDWISLYANIIDFSIFAIFGMTYYVNMSLMDTLFIL